MFPIIPAHMLNGSSSTSLGKMTINSSNGNYTNAFWNIWTEDFLRRKYISAATNDFNGSFTNEASELKNRDNCKKQVIKSESKINNGSYAIEAIPKDSKTRSFDCIDIHSEQIIDGKSFICIDSSGFISNDQNYSISHWLRSLSLAHDTYSHNAQLEITSDHRLRIKIVKNLVIDEEIQLWFSDEILAILAVPFLTPSNILGKNCYKCTECSKTYENPNPLKIHLATKCDRYTIEDLWSRLNNILQSKSLQPSISPFSQSSHSLIQHFESSSSRSSQENDALRTGLPYVPSTNLPFQTFQNDNKLNQTYHQFQMHQHMHHLSAFQPVPLSPPQMHQLVTHSAHQFVRHEQFNRSVATTSTNSSAQGEKVVAAAAAQLETIVSNMGTSKQGHICIYCGKLYSRKYGLKIHIRTHTGFKPLKCKYCFRPFGDPSNLNKHIRLHVQEKSLYKCHLCNKILVRRRDLLRHMNIKHNVSETNPRISGDGENSNDNTTNSSINEFNETSSSRSNSGSSDVACDLSSNDDDEDFDVRVDVD